jgi:DNA-binding transcriptional ArsR family regulator
VGTPVATKTKRKAVEDRLVRAAAHPVRLQAFTILAERPASPKQIEQEIGVDVGTISYHVKVLKELELVELVDTAQRRGATEHFYRAIERPIHPVEEWKKLSRSERESTSVFTAQLLLNDTARSMNSGTFDNRFDRHLSRLLVQVDEAGWKELDEIFLRTFYEIEEVGEKSATRAGESGDETFPVTAGLMCFERPPKP